MPQLHDVMQLRMVGGAGAVLYDARELFDAHSPRADGLLRSIAQELPAAVAACASAAAADLDPLRQAQLLKVPARPPASASPKGGRGRGGEGRNGFTAEHDDCLPDLNLLHQPGK